jgi:hypothetical protein
MTIKEYIIDRLLEFDPTLDTSDNSALVDLLVNPGSAMLDPVIAQLNFLLTNLGLASPETIDESEFDSIAANFLKSRKQGAKAVGVVELFYNNPINLDIPQGTTFTSSTGVVFETTQAIHIPLSSMAGNTWNFPRYSTGPIPVSAQEFGVIGSIPPNDIKSTNLVPAPALVTNPSAFSGGADKETNTDFAARLIDETLTAALGSSASIKANLSPAYPTIESVKTRGMNDVEMLRDLVYSGIQVYSNYYNVDFYGKISGLNEPPFPQSIAYWNVFYDDPNTSGLIPDLPIVTEFTDQFTTGQYGGIYDLNDALKTTVQTTIVLEDDFQAPTLDPAWILSDSVTGLGILKDANEFLLTTVSGTQMLRLGNRLSPDDADAQALVSISQAQLYNILNMLKSFNRFGKWLWRSSIFDLQIRQFQAYNDLIDFIQADDDKDNNMLSPEERQVWNIIRSLSDAALLEKTHNFYPLATRTLAKHAGVTITGRFQTDDTSTDGRLSYVTVLRDPDSIDPTNGYGFAWMKNDASNSIFNVYLVDNSTLSNDLFVSTTTIVLPQGENQFKAAAKVDIKADKLYRFKLVIGDDYSMSLKIWLNGSAEPGIPTLSTGAPQNVTADGSHIGFGVMGTQNGQWFYDDLLVENNAGVHTALLYRLKADPAEFPNGSLARVNHYGYAYDGTTYGLSAFIKHFNGSVWEWVEIGTNTSTNVSDREVTRLAYDFTMNTDYRDTDNFIDVLITSTEAQTTVTEATSYYVNLETGIPSGVHTGGCADIYINDPGSILVAEQTLNNVTGNILLDTSNGFMGPLHTIVDVQTALIGDSLTENTDWTLITTNAATAYSVQEYPYLAFSPDLANTKVKIIYRYYAYGQDVQNRVSSDQYRYSGASNLSKIMPPCVVRINNLRYRGNLSVGDAQLAIANYVNTQPEKVTRNEIINALYTAGVSFVDLTNVDIEIILHNYKRETQDPEQLVSEYIKPDLSAFFTDSYEMTGVIKL